MPTETEIGPAAASFAISCPHGLVSQFWVERVEEGAVVLHVRGPGEDEKLIRLTAPLGFSIPLAELDRTT